MPKYELLSTLSRAQSVQVGHLLGWWHQDTLNDLAAVWGPSLVHCWKGANYKTQLSQIHLCIKPTTSIGALGIESDSEKLRLHRRFYTLEASRGHFVEIVRNYTWHFNTCSVPPSIWPPLEQSCNWLQNISNENENCRSTSAALALLLLRDVALVRERDAGRHNAFCT